MPNRQYLSGLLPNVLTDLERKNRDSLYFNDPVLWARDFLGVRLWDSQEKIARSVASDHDVSVKAGHGVGKTYTAAIIIAWWVDTRWRLEGKCFVVTTAPSLKQVNATIWRELRYIMEISKKRHAEYKQRIASNSPLGEYAANDHEMPGYITSDAHWRLPSGVELGYGTKPPEGKDDTMSGIHARYVLGIGDEAVGLSEKLIGDLANITSNETSRRLLICNPTNPVSYVGKLFKDKPDTWTFQTLSVFDSPNFHGGGICDCPEHRGKPKGLGFSPAALESFVDQSYVDGKLAEFGADHPEYIARVMGEFAWDAGPMLISPDELAVGLDLDVLITDDLPVLGVDVSRSEKGDMNVIYACYRGVVQNPKSTNEEEDLSGEVDGFKIRFVDAWNDRDGMKTAVRIHEAALSMGAPVVYIDGSGLGGPIYNRVVELAEGRYYVGEVLGGNPAPGDNRSRFYNVRAWWFSELRRKIYSGLVDVDHEDTKLQEELLSIQTKFPASGAQRLLIESKEDMRKRGVGSPDYADAAMYSLINFSELMSSNTRPRVVLEFEQEPFNDRDVYSGTGFSAPF